MKREEELKRRWREAGDDEQARAEVRKWFIKQLTLKQLTATQGVKLVDLPPFERAFFEEQIIEPYERWVEVDPSQITVVR
jgi:hypothetical protein